MRWLKAFSVLFSLSVGSPIILFATVSADDVTLREFCFVVSSLDSCTIFCEGGEVATAHITSRLRIKNKLVCMTSDSHSHHRFISIMNHVRL